MATVYILYSRNLDKFYIGSCVDLNKRLAEHIDKTHANSFTMKTNDWILFYKIEDLEYQQARKIEKHIKNMKSSNYIKNLALYPEISERLKEKYA